MKVLMEVVTPQTGRAEGSERLIIRGNALHCEGHVEGQLSAVTGRTEQKISTVIKGSTGESAANPTAYFLIMA